MRQAVKLGVVLPAVMLLASGCVATRGWVTEHVGKKEVEIDQRVAGVDKKLTEETQRVDQKVDGVDTKLTQTSEVARGARERADGAYTKADETNSRLTRLWSNRNVRKEAETYQILFGFDKWDLNDAGQTTLGIELPRIHLVGLGPIAEKGTPNKDKRRVTVKLMVAQED
ncbi:MAG: hypothetical protein DMD95_08610 [Candidatus Rokuibacteriota bacterium]|nr:MAG: hypothetical protein DMD95_08610 [Candidatus Rokubacteria bacterium]